MSPLGASIFHSVLGHAPKPQVEVVAQLDIIGSGKAGQFEPVIDRQLMIARRSLSGITVHFHQDAHLVFEVGRRKVAELIELLQLGEEEPRLVKAQECVQPPVVARVAQQFFVPGAGPGPFGPRLLQEPAEKRHQGFVGALGHGHQPGGQLANAARHAPRALGPVATRLEHNIGDLARKRSIDAKDNRLRSHVRDGVAVIVLYHQRAIQGEFEAAAGLPTLLLRSSGAEQIHVVAPADQPRRFPLAQVSHELDRRRVRPLGFPGCRNRSQLESRPINLLAEPLGRKVQCVPFGADGSSVLRPVGDPAAASAAPEGGAMASAPMRLRMAGTVNGKLDRPWDWEWSKIM